MLATSQHRWRAARDRVCSSALGRASTRGSQIGREMLLRLVEGFGIVILSSWVILGALVLYDRWAYPDAPSDDLLPQTGDLSQSGQRAA